MWLAVLIVMGYFWLMYILLYLAVEHDVVSEVAVAPLSCSVPRGAL